MALRKGPKNYFVNFYWRKLGLFVGVFAVVFLSYLFIKPYHADVNVYVPPEVTGNLDLKVTVLADGGIKVNDKKIPDRVNSVGDAQEIRFPIIDNPGQYYSNVTVEVDLPKGVGYSSNPEMKGIHGVGSVSAYVKDSNTLIYTASEVSPTATLSIIASLPPNTVNPPFTYKAYTFLNNIRAKAWIVIGISLPVAACLFLIIFIGYEIRRERIDKPKDETSAPPMALPPAVVGVLYHQKVSPREIAATLIDLAYRGDITIIDKERDFSFLKNKFDRRLLSYEKILLSKIFRDNIMTSDQEEIERRINNHLYSRKISLVTSGIYNLTTRLGYFKTNPQKVHQKYIVFGVLGTMVGVGGFILSLIAFRDPPYIAFFWVGMIISTIITAIIARNIPIRTVLGQEAISNWIAFRKFLCGKEKLQFSYDNQNIFQRYLPYAIVLDCEVAWAKRFSEQSFVLPDWFVSTRNGLGLEDFCLSLFPIVSYVSRSLASIREPGFE